MYSLYTFVLMMMIMVTYGIWPPIDLADRICGLNKQKTRNEIQDSLSAWHYGWVNAFTQGNNTDALNEFFELVDITFDCNSNEFFVSLAGVLEFASCDELKEFFGGVNFAGLTFGTMDLRCSSSEVIIVRVTKSFRNSAGVETS